MSGMGGAGLAPTGPRAKGWETAMSALAALLNRFRRRRLVRLLTRNARWVREARDTPTVWTDYQRHLLEWNPDGEDPDGVPSGR
jgi:hypothetical protein